VGHRATDLVDYLARQYAEKLGARLKKGPFGWQGHLRTRRRLRLLRVHLLGLIETGWCYALHGSLKYTAGSHLQICRAAASRSGKSCSQPWGRGGEEERRRGGEEGEGQLFVALNPSISGTVGIKHCLSNAGSSFERVKHPKQARAPRPQKHTPFCIRSYYPVVSSRPKPLRRPSWKTGWFITRKTALSLGGNPGFELKNPASETGQPHTATHRARATWSALTLRAAAVAVSVGRPAALWNER